MAVHGNHDHDQSEAISKDVYGEAQVSGATPAGKAHFLRTSEESERMWDMGGMTEAELQAEQTRLINEHTELHNQHEILVQQRTVLVEAGEGEGGLGLP